MKIGQNGKAIILDEKGRVVAGSDMLEIAAQAHWQFDKMAIDAKQMLSSHAHCPFIASMVRG